ncbi:MULTISPECIES: DUF6931 family protein [unclassified Sphingomonas]|uniref:DUF6931 family protein n=1 Tax=unclassified Sphingomonas TaxID=196159 RepID=UPI00082D6922|nr:MULTISPECIES: hypothetical protein [unclassified Sphingomonas]
MASTPVIALRYQRVELEQKANLSPAGRAVLAGATGPERLIAALAATGNYRDAVYALTMILPHRQAAWWACLAVRLLPDLAARAEDLAAVEVAEHWVQSTAPVDAERAGEAADRCNLDLAPGWAAMAAYWSGASIAPRGQQPVPPAPHLPGVATRTALLLLTLEPALSGRVSLGDFLEIGLALMKGDVGRTAQASVRARLAGG